MAGALGENAGEYFVGTNERANVDRVAMRWGLARIVPSVQIHPRIVVDFGATVVFDADKRRSARWNASNTRLQFARSSAGEFPPQYKSSASFTTIPSLCDRQVFLTIVLREPFRTRAFPSHIWRIP